MKTSTIPTKTERLSLTTPVFRAHRDGVTVLAWFDETNAQYAVRSYSPGYLSLEQTQWLVVQLFKAQAHVLKRAENKKKLVY